MSKESQKVKDVMPTYRAFLAGRLLEIWAAWDNGNIEQSLRRALRLVTFLPRALKKQLRKDKETITKALNGAYKVSGVDWYTRQQNRNRAARRVASLYLEPFVDEMVDLLDAGGYLVKAFKAVPTGKELGY